MAQVLRAPEDTWSFHPMDGAHYQRYERRDGAQPAAESAEAERTPEQGSTWTGTELASGGGLSLDAIMNDTAGGKWTPPQQKDHPEVCIPTNPGTLLHPGSCTPCAFVFRVAEGQVRNRCTNGDQCGWCHHPSHPRTRGRRQKNNGAAREKKEDKETWADKNNGSETSTRDSWSDRESKAKQTTWTEGDDRAKTTTRSTKEDRMSGKSNRAPRDDRAKTNRQRNDRDDRSKNYRPTPEKAPERCSTPEFDEQFSMYPRAQHPQGLIQEDCFGQAAPILYSCVPVHVAVPTPAAEGMPEWAGYAPTAAYVQDWNPQYQPEARAYAPQQYMMVQMQPQSNWQQFRSEPAAVRVDNDGMNRSRA
jgi:hypothetical protein